VSEGADGPARGGVRASLICSNTLPGAGWRGRGRGFLLRTPRTRTLLPNCRGRDWRGLSIQNASARHLSLGSQHRVDRPRILRMSGTALGAVS
jgi:hypothetical protein